MARWQCSSNSAVLVTLALTALMCGKPRSEPKPASGATKSAEPAPAPENSGPRIEDSDLKLSLEVPAGWKAVQKGGRVSLFTKVPSGRSIDLGFYEPRNQAQYDSWAAWSKQSLRKLSRGRTVRRRQTLTIDGHQALRLDTIDKQAPAGDKRTVAETWIARPSAKAGEGGEVLVVILDGADDPAARAAYDQVLASLRLLP